MRICRNKKNFSSRGMYLAHIGAVLRCCGVAVLVKTYNLKYLKLYCLNLETPKAHVCNILSCSVDAQPVFYLLQSKPSKICAMVSREDTSPPSKEPAPCYICTMMLHGHWRSHQNGCFCYCAKPSSTPPPSVWGWEKPQQPYPRACRPTCTCVSHTHLQHTCSPELVSHMQP